MKKILFALFTLLTLSASAQSAFKYEGLCMNAPAVDTVTSGIYISWKDTAALKGYYEIKYTALAPLDTKVKFDTSAILGEFKLGQTYYDTTASVIHTYNNTQYFPVPSGYLFVNGNYAVRVEKWRYENGVAIKCWSNVTFFKTPSNYIRYQCNPITTVTQNYAYGLLAISWPFNNGKSWEVSYTINGGAPKVVPLLTTYINIPLTAGQTCAYTVKTICPDNSASQISGIYSVPAAATPTKKTGKR